MINTLNKIYIYEPKKISLYLPRYILITASLFFIPLLLDLPQIIQGTIINFILIYIALNYKKMALIPAVLLPSLGSTIRGGLLGTATIYLIILMPVIWISNLLFIAFIRYLVINKFNGRFSLIASSLIKSLFLFISAYILFSLSMIPEFLLPSMGIIQFITALSASTIYLMIKKI
jgi:hypothetical protein